jgi:tRNA(adenine34) deaminase
MTEDVTPFSDEYFMRAALNEAEAALEHQDVPVGAVVVRENRIIGRGHNEREQLRDPTAHAELLALTAAAQAVDHWRLDGCILYVTLEPCPMCAGALVLARLERLVFGTADPKAGACGSLYSIPTDERLNHRLQVTSGILEMECAHLLKAFFAARRALGHK